MTKNTLASQYNPADIEKTIYQRWEDTNDFSVQANASVSNQAEQNGQGSYCISIPPPNVTGSLHMGHAFQDTIMDLLIRYNRMLGKKTLWQVGTDHAGIATQMVVERRLSVDGLTRHDLGREKFTEEIWKWKEESGGTITEQLRRMGASVDWQRERFTMDEGLSESVQDVFVRLFSEGLIYRGKRLVNWDPVLETAVSDLEVESEEENGHMWHLRYPLANDPSKHLIVATTRPETMLGDSAVAVHPEDERFAELIGQQITLPLTGRTIPIIADDYVDPEFGSGCVKITPAHDFNDYEVGKRHDLPKINILNKNAGIELEGSKYHGLDRYEARKQIINDLETEGLLERIEDHKLMVPRGDRSNSVIEPFLTDQWYVKVAPLAEQAIRVVKEGDIKFVPENWENTYFQWMNNIEDWCISRQIWWGHRIPAWYDDDGNVYVAKTEDEATQKAIEKTGNQSIQLQQDNDVLDTWFSSALWPFSTLGWPEETPELADFYPNNVLVTGFDIIFFWVARMIMFGCKFTDKVPFKEVYIHGLVRDQEGQKMSKSKGNVLDPIDLIDGIDLETLVAKRTSGLMKPKIAKKIEKSTRKQFPDGIESYGTDALRFTFASQATLGRDIRFDLGRIDGYRNFCNKLWNAARYVLMNTEGHDCGIDHTDYALSLADKWIISRLQEVETEVAQNITDYRFDQMASNLYQFVWDEYCSWYLELSKITLNNDDANREELAGTRRTLVLVLDAILRLLHPVMPFITEEIWQQTNAIVKTNASTIMLCSFPQAENEKIDQTALDDMAWVQAIITGVRNIRGEMNISPSKPLPVLLENANKVDLSRLGQFNAYLTKFGRIESINTVESKDAPESAAVVVGDMNVLLPLGSLIDPQEELQRLSKELEKAQKEIDANQAKIDNEQFTSRAPDHVVNTVRETLETALKLKESLLEQKIKIEKMI